MDDLIALRREETRIVKRRPINDHGAAHFRKTLSYRDTLRRLRRPKRVMMAARRGMPTKAATLVATVVYEIVT